MEPYIFQSWGAVGQFTGLSGETKFPHLQMGSGWAGSPLGTTVPGGCLCFGQTAGITAPSQWGW